MSKRSIVLAALCLLLPAAAFAQAPQPVTDHGRILGVVVSNSVGPLIAADVTVRNQADSTVARVATAIDGRFLIDNLAFGTYTVRVTYVGYRVRVIDAVKISRAEPLADLGTVAMDAVLIAKQEIAEKR